MKAVDKLTSTEEAILFALADGRTHREIALERYVSVETIKSHKQHLFQKLGAKNTAHAVALAYHYGILKPMMVG
jgi:DNA-binding NarL/FixJ family response regulator